MEELNIPIIKGKIPGAKILSMNDYLKFVYLHLRYTFNKDANKEWKKMSGVNAPFFLK